MYNQQLSTSTDAVTDNQDTYNQDTDNKDTDNQDAKNLEQKMQEVLKDILDNERWTIFEEDNWTSLF